MITLSDVVDLQELDSAIDSGFVKVSYSPDGIDRIYNYTDLAQFSPTAFDNEAVRACRGLIVDDKDSVIARSWRKFFNYGQKPDDIDPSSLVEVTDKLDGSLGIIHYDVGNKVRVATRGSFISEQALHATEWLKSTGWKPPSVYILHDYTILVEIIYPDNRIVCDYGDLDTLSLLGAVEVDTGRYLSIDEALELVGPDWPGTATEVLPYKTLTEALSAPPRDGKEGMCVHFLGKNHIVKIKQADYIALHKLVFNLSTKAIWERLVAGDSVDKIIDGLPDEFHTWVRDTAGALISQADDTVSAATELYKSLASNTGSRKEFALEATKTAYASYLFALYDGKDIYQMALKSIKPSGKKLITHSEDEA